jgi:acyl-CoA thioester hydrolase
MRPPAIPLEKLESLPLVYRVTIPDEYRDGMGHMNMRWYIALFDEAGIPLFDRLGLTMDYYQQNHAGGFDLEHHTHFLNEVHIGDTVVFRARLLGRSAKRLHYMLFMVNETHGVLAATLELINSHADFNIRRTSPYPENIAAQIDAILVEHTRLDWDAPICGAMKP